MTTFPNSPKLLKGGIVLIAPESGAVGCIIALQYNPDTLSRTLQVKGVGEGGDRSQALRLRGPPAETVKLDAEIDATDQLEIADGTATEVGLHPQLAALEILVYPTSSHLQSNNSLAAAGTLEIAPVGRSESNCFDGVGYVITKIANDCCTRPCTVEHEVHHVRDLDECCKAYHRARKAPGANKDVIDEAWATWLEVARNVSECRAYSDDLTCAQRLAVLKGCVPEPEGKGRTREVTSNSRSVSGEFETVSDGVSEATAQDAVFSPAASGGMKELSGCCNDITDYAEMFAPETKWWCSLAAGRTIPPCPFTSKRKRP